MPGWRGRLCLLAAALLLPIAGACADPSRGASSHSSSPASAGGEAVLKRGEHPGFTRFVFHLPPHAAAQVQAGMGDATVTVLGAPVAIGHATGLPNVSVAGNRVTLHLPAGAHLRQMHLPGRLVVDIVHDGTDTPPAKLPLAAVPAAPPAAQPAARAARASPTPMPKPTPVDAPRPAAPAPAVAMPMPAIPAPASTAALLPAPSVPVAVPPVAATPVAPVAPSAPAPEPPAVPAAPAAALSFAPGTGAAAFRSGEWAVAVFDQARTLDPATLHALPGLATADVARLATATEIRLRLPPGQALALAQGRSGWALSVVADPPPMRPVQPAAQAGGLALPLDRPGRVVSVPDPDTGGLLLVGTEALPRRALRAAAAAAAAGTPLPPDSQGVAVERHTPLFGLLTSWQGVAVAPGADDLVLRATETGFRLERTAAGQSLTLADADADGRTADAASFSRLFDLPDASLPQLARRLGAAAGLASLQPPQSRGPARLAAAQAMLALGMGAEASGLVRLAETDDARLVADPRAEALGGAAGLLAGRLDEAAGLAEPALTVPGAQGGDEVMLWRGLLAATQADRAQRPDPAAAALLASKLPLLESYPAPLRDRLLPLALRTMALGGKEAVAGRALAALPHSPGLDFSRALLAEHDGHMPAALGLMDRLAQDRNRDVAARAAVRAVEIRLASHAYAPREAADALDPLICAWRGDGRELAVRLRESALRLAAGQPREALALLREAQDPVLAAGWLDQRAAIAERLRAGFAEAVSRDAGQPMPALDFIAMVQENADQLSDGPQGQVVAQRVADRLAALDLPDQAASVLSRLVERAPPGLARATLGLRLAGLQLDRHDAPAALMTLSATTQANLPAPLVAERTAVFARATAANGHLDAAIGALRALNTPAATDLEARLQTEAGHWPQATSALVRLVQTTLPATGALDAPQSALLLRLASAAAQANDAPVLAAVRDQELSRVPPGKTADLLRMLTEGPVTTVADLPRASAEMNVARSALK